MEERCRLAGVVFQPMVFDSLGGVSSEADRVIKSLNQAVADNTDSPPSEIATRFWQRVSIDMQRMGHRAFVRRVVSGDDGLGFVGGGLNVRGFFCSRFGYRFEVFGLSLEVLEQDSSF